MSKQYAVCHLQRGSGNDSGMSCHIERKDVKGKTYVPDNADRNRTHLNRELIAFPDGVKNRTEAIQYRLDNAGLHRKVGKNQCKAIRIILTGTHEQMMKIQDSGRLDKWTEANLKWLRETFGTDNLVSCVLHMDEKTPHLHATIVPIVTTDRKRREREGETKYNIQSGPRLSAEDVFRRAKLHEYQNTYAAAMKEFGLKRGIVGSTARHIDTSDYYKQQMQQYEDDIAKLQEEVEKTKEGKNSILALFGKGDLAKAKKELTLKDEELAKLQTKIAQLEAEKTALMQKHASDIAKLRNGYQKEISAAIHRAEAVEKNIIEKERIIERQQKEIEALDRKANPQRYRLSSGAELLRINVANYHHPSLHIWTRVGDALFEDTKFLIDYNTAQAHLNGQITDEEFVNAVFEPQEQVNEAQINLLGAAFEIAIGGQAQVHVGTGSGSSSSELPWNDKDTKKHTPIKRR